MTRTSIKTGSIYWFVVLAVVLLAGAISARDATAQATDTWQNLPIGKWSQGARWSTKAPPKANENAVIGNKRRPGGAVSCCIVHLNQNGTAMNLTINSGYTLSMVGPDDPDEQTLELNLGGNLINQKGAELTIANFASLSVKGDFTTAGITSIDSPKGEGGSTMTMTVGKKLRITPSGNLSIGNKSMLVVTTVTAGTLKNEGTLSLEGNKPDPKNVLSDRGATLHITGDAESSKLVTIKKFAALEVDGAYTQTGGVTRVGGTKADSGESARLKAGSIDLKKNASLVVGNGGNVITLREVDGNGDVLKSGNFDNLGKFQVDPETIPESGFGGSSVTIGGKLSNEGSISIGNKHIAKPTSVTAKELENFGSITITGGKGKGKEASLTVNGTATNNLAGSIDIQNNAMVAVGGGYTQMDGKTAIQSGGQLTTQGDYIQQDGKTIVRGILDAKGHTVKIDGGTLEGSKNVKNPNGGKIIGNAVNKGSVIPGFKDPAPGTMTIDGNYTQTASGALVEMFNGTGAGDFGVLDITGAASLGGSLEVDTISPFAQGFTLSDAGDMFPIMTYSSFSGGFTSLDYNGDILSAIGTSPLGLPDSFALDGIILNLLYTPDAAYLEIAAAAAPTPEPASLLLFGSGLLGLAFGWRRWQRRRTPARELTASRP